MVEVSDFLKYFYWCFQQKQVSVLPTCDKILLRSRLQIIACDVIFTRGMIELLMVCFVFVSVDHPECEACYLETLEQDNYHQGKSSLIMLFYLCFQCIVDHLLCPICMLPRYLETLVLVVVSCGRNTNTPILGPGTTMLYMLCSSRRVIG